MTEMNYDALIVGGGFGGAFAARELERRLRHREQRVLLVAPDNFLLFSPLLPEAASGTIEPRHSVIPLREFLRRTDLIAGTIESLDIVGRTAMVVDEGGERTRVAFRTVVIAPGSAAMILPIPGLLDHAVGFRNLTDAIWLRNHVLAQLEAANAATDARGGGRCSRSPSSAAGTPASKRWPSSNRWPATRCGCTPSSMRATCDGC